MRISPNRQSSHLHLQDQHKCTEHIYRKSACCNQGFWGNLLGIVECSCPRSASPVCVKLACFIASGKRQGLWKTEVRNCNSFSSPSRYSTLSFQRSDEMFVEVNVNVWMNNRGAFQSWDCLMSELVQTVMHHQTKYHKSNALTYIWVNIKHMEHPPKNTLQTNSL